MEEEALACCMVYRKDKVVDAEKVQDFLRFNPYILSGYRKPMSSVISVFLSLFYLHNETLNIYLHLFSSLYLFISAYYHADHQLYISIHGVFLGVGFLGSCVYHAMMPHCKTSEEYQTYLSYDLAFGLIGIFGSAHSVYIYGYRCYSPIFSYSLFIILAIVCVLTIRKTITAKSVKGRMLAAGQFALLRAGFAMVFFIPRVMQLGFTKGVYCHSSSLFLVSLGGILNISRYPEKRYPGCYDYGVNSHVLWHICTLVSALLCYYGNAQDLIDYQNTSCL